MMRSKIVMSFVLFLGLSFGAHAELKVGTTLTPFELTGDDGGRLDGSPWSTKELAGKVSVLFYVDPDVKDLNEKFGDLLKDKDYSKDLINYVAIINMEATPLPNFLIASSLKVKQRRYTSTLYLKDYTKKLAREVKFVDDDYNILILDAQGKILFFKNGKMNDEEITKAIGLIEGHFPKKS